MFKYYPVYKDSGIKWIGNIPEIWKIKKIKYVSRINQLALGDETDGSYEFNYIDIGNVDLEKGYSITEKVNFLNAPSRARRIVRKGDSIVSTVRTYLKAIAHFEEDVNDFIVSTGFAVVTPGSKLEPKFIYYILRSEKIIDRICALSVGVSYPAINSSDLADIEIWYPDDISEQRCIVAFLDHNTAQIDDLITKKEQMIKLLKEECAAVINQAVTKGIDPKAEMKDSGIEWLGMIPKHWSLRKIKYLVKYIKGYAFKTETFLEHGKPVVKASDIKNLSIRAGKDFINEENAQYLRNFKLKLNDLIISTVGSTPDVINSAVGQIARVPIEFEGAYLNQNTVKISCRNENLILNDFIFYIITSTPYRKYLDLHAHGTANQASLDIEDMLNFIIPIPSLTEQNKILGELEKSTNTIASTISQLERGVEYLKEYRTALISEVVTGKIDVRFEKEIDNG